MATAKKLPSGSWRCLAYSHSEPITKDGKPVLDEKGKPKVRRIYESFTSDDPSPKGRKEAEAAALAFQVDRDKPQTPKCSKYGDMTLFQAIDNYIGSRENLKRSPTTIQEYRCTQKYAFRDIMSMQLKDLNEELLQESINKESLRCSLGKNKRKPISAKRLRNEWGLIASILNKYHRSLEYNVELPRVAERVPELIPADVVLSIIRGTDIELAVLLAAWLSFTMSEVRGLTKSKSINGDYIRIAEVIVDIGGKPVRKDEGKNPARNRTHRIPPYIKQLIDQVEGDVLVPINGRVLYGKWIRLLKDNNLPHMTFHDLRHLNASVMALLRIPDKYAQERGGWKSDKVMKRVYTQTFHEERVKVDDTVDNYFESLLDSQEREDEKELSDEEILELLKTQNPDGWREALLQVCNTKCNIK